MFTFIASDANISDMQTFPPKQGNNCVWHLSKLTHALYKNIQTPSLFCEWFFSCFCFPSTHYWVIMVIYGYIGSTPIKHTFTTSVIFAGFNIWRNDYGPGFFNNYPLNKKVLKTSSLHHLYSGVIHPFPSKHLNMAKCVNTEASHQLDTD